jgi:selenoprotein W-related protein
MLNIEIVYCAVWHYTDRAVGLANELLKAFEYDIRGLTLVPSDGGRFEVSVNDKLVYSKLQTHRHAEPGEVVGLVRKVMK